LLAGGGLGAVALIGVVLALVFGGGDDKKVQPPPATPTSAQPTNEPTAPVDEGIEVGEGVFVKPQPGYLRETLDNYKGVYLLKRGEAYLMVEAFKPNASETPATVMAQLLKAETKSLTEVKLNKPAEVTPTDGNVKYMTSTGYSATSTSQNGTLQVVGLVGVIQRNDGVLTIFQVYGRKDKLTSSQKAVSAMLESVIKSQ
jgi:hypothetical protein